MSNTFQHKYGNFILEIAIEIFCIILDMQRTRTKITLNDYGKLYIYLSLIILQSCYLTSLYLLEKTQQRYRNLSKISRIIYNVSIL